MHFEKFISSDRVGSIVIIKLFLQSPILYILRSLFLLIVYDHSPYLGLAFSIVIPLRCYVNHPYCFINTYVFEVSAAAVDREQLAKGQEKARQFTFDDTEYFRIKE